MAEAKTPLQVNGKTLDEIIANECKEATTELWGQKVTFTPVCCEEFLGDGQQLIYVVSTFDRPHYWLARIDSATDISCEDFDYDEVITLIQESFGFRPQEGDDNFVRDDQHLEQLKLENEDFLIYKDYNDWWESVSQYPTIDWGGGDWGLIVNMVTGEVGDMRDFPETGGNEGGNE